MTMDKVIFHSVYDFETDRAFIVVWGTTIPKLQLFLRLNIIDLFSKFDFLFGLFESFESILKLLVNSNKVFNEHHLIGSLYL